jgi:hypothetical protein
VSIEAASDYGTVRQILDGVQGLSIVVGVVITILSFNVTRRKDAETRQKEAEARKIEAARPFLELRQATYIEALKASAVLVNSDVHTECEVKEAKKRFRDLYVSELSMVEPPEVEAQMVALADSIDPELLKFTAPQQAAFDLAHALRDSFVASYGLPTGETEELVMKDRQRG